MEKYDGKKYYVSDTCLVRDYSDPWCNEVRYKEKANFKMTKEYKEYLRNKRNEEIKTELMTLRAKWDYQYKTYGEVDPIDFQEYQYKLKKYGY